VTFEGRWLGLRGFRIEGDDEALMWRHVCVKVKLILVTSSPVNVVGGNLTQKTNLHIFLKP